MPPGRRSLPRFAVLVGLVALLGLLAACTGRPGSSPGFSGAPVGSALVQVGGLVTRGPVCPVERNPPDPSCAPRPVQGAVLVIADAAGRTVAQATSAADGRWTARLPAGSYVVAPQPVQGLLGRPQPLSFQVTADGASRSLDVEYDTGIR